MAAFTVGPFDWVIRFVVTLLLIFTFSCILLRPLWKLAMSRPSLIIVFSRAIGCYLRLLGDIPRFLVSNIFNIPMTPDDSYFWTFVYSFNGYIHTMLLSAHVHNLALAINRVHAMFFPFHYNMVFVKKKKIYVLCLCLWLFCICVGSSNQFVMNKIGTSFPGSPVGQLNNYCIYASGLCYVGIGCRLLWMRYKSSSLGGASTEKDTIKVLVVCFSCLAMAALYDLVFSPFVDYVKANFSDTPRLAVYWGNNITTWLFYFTEEICLTLLVPEFRQNLKQQLRTVFCCCCRENSIAPTTINNINNNNNMYSRNNYSIATSTRAEQPIRMIQVTRVNNLVNGIG